jgi:hypothetical protein
VDADGDVGTVFGVDLGVRARFAKIPDELETPGTSGTAAISVCGRSVATGAGGAPAPTALQRRRMPSTRPKFQSASPVMRFSVFM